MNMLVVEDIYTALYYDIYERSTVVWDDKRFESFVLANDEYTSYAITGKGKI